MTVKIDARQAHHRLLEGGLLVCAYDDEGQWKKNRIEEAIPLSEFRAQEESIPRDREIIFYCGCPKEETSAGVADQYAVRGFSNVAVLKGGTAAWERAKESMAAAI